MNLPGRALGALFLCSLAACTHYGSGNDGFTPPGASSSGSGASSGSSSSSSGSGSSSGSSSSSSSSGSGSGSSSGSGGGSANASFPPYEASDAAVLVDIGIASLKPRNTWQHLPAGFLLQQVGGRTAGTVSDSSGFVPNSGGYIANPSAFPAAASSQGTIYLRVQRAALSADNSASSGATFYDSTGNTGGGFGASAASAFTVFDNNNNILQWVMAAQPVSEPAILKAGNWLYPGQRAANSHSSAFLDSTYADLVITWQGTSYWTYFDGAIVGSGSFTTPFPATGLFSQLVIGAYLGGAGVVGQPLGPYTVQRYQLSTRYSPPPSLAGAPKIGFYGDSFVVQAGGVSGEPPNPPTTAQVDAVQAQLDYGTTQNAAAGPIGQTGFISLAQAAALKNDGGFLKIYTAAQSGHGWAYTGMGGSSAADTPAIDDFSLGKSGFSDALDAAQPDYLFAFGSVNDVNNGTPADIVGDVKAHFDYWADHNPNLKGIYYVETLSWELSSGASTSHGGQAGWIAEMARQRGLLRAAYGNGYTAGARQVPVTYIKTYETWVQGPNAARFLIATNPDNKTQSADGGSAPNGHPDAEGNVQIMDAYIWPYLMALLQH